MFQINFLYQRDFVQPFHAAGLTLTATPSLSPGAIYDLNFFLVERAEGWRASCEYNPDLYESGTIQRLLAHFQTLLAGIVADPGRRISQLPMVTASERQQLLVECNGTGTESPRSSCLHEQFEAQAERRPDSVAVRFENQQLTYAELNARSNQLAHYLRARGVGPEVLVALYMERSLEMIVGILAILKAGGAYLPIDRAYPPDAFPSCWRTPKHRCS